jgi:hypothetical protein
LVVQQAEAETDSVVKVGLTMFRELGERMKKLESFESQLETELRLYRNMVIELATREGVEVPDFVKDGIGGLGEEQVGQLREWLEQLSGRLAAGEEATTGRTSSRKRGRHGRVEERLSLEGAVAEQKKRKWQDIVDESVGSGDPFGSDVFKPKRPACTKEPEAREKWNTTDTIIG